VSSQITSFTVTEQGSYVKEYFSQGLKLLKTYVGIED
jgi:hypothetical protein